MIHVPSAAARAFRHVGRSALSALLCAAASLAGFAPACAATVVDIAGRTVAVPARVDRILLGEGRLLYALALIEGERPLARIASWQGDLAFVDPNGYAAYRTRFPEIDRIPVIGHLPAPGTGLGRYVAERPDIAIFGIAGHGPARPNGLIDELERAGVPVVFVDFRNQPARNTAASMRILGTAVHREENARAYADFYEQHLDRVKARVAAIPQSERPRVFVELLAGVWSGCCHTVGKGNMGEFIAVAGGLNVAQDRFDAPIGDISPRTLAASEPEVYIATGSRPEGNRLMLRAGSGVATAELATSLQAIAARPEIGAMPAIGQARVHGLWHNFYDAPTNILAIEAMAGWLHPARFQDLDVQASLDEINRRFLSAVPMRGSYWGSLAK